VVVEGGYLQHLAALWALGQKGTGLPVVSVQLASVTANTRPIAKGATSKRKVNINITLKTCKVKTIINNFRNILLLTSRFSILKREK